MTYNKFTGAQENGTCVTIFPLFDVKPEDLLFEKFDKGVMGAPPLKLEDLEFTESKAEMWTDCMIYMILHVIVFQGGKEFERWKPELQKSQPESSDKIPVHKTNLHPLPSMEIEEASIVGNVYMIEAINKALGLDPKSPKYMKYVKILAGDQLTVACQRAIVNIRVSHESGAAPWKQVVTMPGIFHGKIADCHGLLETHFGKPNAGTRSPGGLSFHNTVLNRQPIILTSLPTF